MDLTNAQWEILGPLLPPLQVRADGRGRPWRDPRDVLNGILWILRTGAPWKDMPERYPPYQTCHRRYQQWVQSGTLENVLRALAKDLASRQQSAVSFAAELRSVAAMFDVRAGETVQSALLPLDDEGAGAGRWWALAAVLGALAAGAWFWFR